MSQQATGETTRYLSMTEVQGTISRYLRASAGTGNWPSLHTLECFVGMIQTGEATMDDMQKIGGKFLVDQLTIRAAADAV